jgi:hypothetical protein
MTSTILRPACCSPGISVIAADASLMRTTRTSQSMKANPTGAVACSVSNSARLPGQAPRPVQSLLKHAMVLSIDQRADPSDGPPIAPLNRNGLTGVQAIHAVPTAQPVLDRERSLSGNRIPPSARHPISVIGMQQLQPLPPDLCLGFQLRAGSLADAA